MEFPNTIGAIDGTYVPIPLPKEYGLSYIARKNFSAIILQAVCDHTLKFVHCYTGEAGSSRDARFLRKSEVWGLIQNRPQEMFPNDTHIIGDKAYPCVPQLIVPYKDNGYLTDAQRHFNYNLSHARSTIERAFGLLKKKFRCLKFLDVRCLQWAPLYVIACCVLHNVCIMQNDILNIKNIQQNEVEEEQENEVVLRADRQMVHLGNMKRNRLCHELFNYH